MQCRKCPVSDSGWAAADETPVFRSKAKAFSSGIAPEYLLDVFFLQVINHGFGDKDFKREVESRVETEYGRKELLGQFSGEEALIAVSMR